MPNVRQETGRGFASNGGNIASMTNTSAEQILFEQMIPAGALGSAKRLDFYLLALLTTAAIAPTLTIRIKMGGSTLSIMNGLSLLGLQNSKPFVVEGKIKNTSEATQEVWAKITKNTSGLVIGGFDMDAASWTIDTTVDQMFRITAQFGSALLGTTLTVKDADMECS